MNAGHKLNKSFNSRFLVYNSLIQVIPTGIQTQIQHNTVVYDLLGEFDNAVLYQFTPLRSGYYLFIAGAHYLNLVAGDVMGVYLVLNGATYGSQFRTQTGVPNRGTQLTKMLHMNRGETMSADTWHNNGANRNLQNLLINTYISGARVG